MVYGLVVSVLLHTLVGLTIVLALSRGTPVKPPPLIEVSVVAENSPPVSSPPQVPRQKKKSSMSGIKPVLIPSQPSPVEPPPGEVKPSAAQASAPGGEGNGPAAADFKSHLWIAIESKKEYPATARARGQTGIVKVGFTLKKDGLIVGIHLSERSEYELLNHAAVDTLVRLGRFQAIPDEVSMGDLSFIVPLNFKLND